MVNLVAYISGALLLLRKVELFSNSMSKVPSFTEPVFIEKAPRFMDSSHLDYISYFKKSFHGLAKHLMHGLTHLMAFFSLLVFMAMY